MSMPMFIVFPQSNQQIPGIYSVLFSFKNPAARFISIRDISVSLADNSNLPEHEDWRFQQL